MKYVTPKYEMSVVETEDILTASSGQAANYEIEQKNFDRLFLNYLSISKRVNRRMLIWLSLSEQYASIPKSQSSLPKL